MAYPILASPTTIGPLQVRNRIVIPPMATYLATAEGVVTERNLAHYRACRGAGLVVVEATAVSPEGRLAALQIGIFHDKHVAGLTKLAKVVHDNGAVAAIQIHHAGRQTTTENTYGLPLLAPSACNPTGEVPQEMDEEDIERVIAAFVDGARRAREAGFDAVELHGAHGYLISQFLSPAANQREDGWGGSFDNRFRFLREIHQRVTEAVGRDLLVYCRLGVKDAVLNGLSLEEGIRAAVQLEAGGLPLIHVSNGIGMPKMDPEPDAPFGYRMRLAGAVRRSVKIPVIGVGDIRLPQDAEAVLQAGVADLTAVGRGVLADPAWAEKALTGAEDRIHRCRSCRLCHHFRYPERCPARREAGRV